MSKFEFLRLSLSKPNISNTAKEYDRCEPDMPRQEFLTEAFSKRHDFFYRQSKYTYIPLPIKNPRENTLAGFIGKPVEELVNAGPDQFFAPTKSKHYKAAFLAIDIATDQQVIAFEKRHDVGAAHGIIIAMLESYVKERKGISWHSDVEYLLSTEEFWKSAEKYRDQITELSFEFYPPNVLEGFKVLKGLDKEIKDATNSDISKYSFRNKDGGVKPEGDFVKSAVEYASEGAGKIMMKKGNRALFDSKQARRTKSVSESLMPRHGDDGKSKILELFDWLFGKKDG